MPSDTSSTRIWLRTLARLALLAALAGFVQWRYDSPAGWIAMAGLLCAGVLWRDRRLARVARWANDPASSPPAAVGPWDDVLAPLYRHVRGQSRQIDEMNETILTLQSAAQALPDGVVSLDDEFHITGCNRAASEHLKLSMATDEGRSLLNLIRSPEFVAYARKGDWSEPILLRLGQDGHERRLLLRLVGYGRGRRLLISRDVTQLEKLETTRRDFVANVSHELRTPLTVLAGFLETLRDLPPEALPDAQREQYMTMMHEQAQRMQAIVADLLTLSALESSPGADPRPVRLPALIHTARQQAEALSEGRHAFDWLIDGELDVLGADTELASAISNLLTNAVRYTPEGGRITVRWQRADDGGARYSVTDTGIGIDAQHLPRLTERFYRVDRGRSRAAGGTGLGLAITRHIAMRHDAELEIASTPGKGSTFALHFPPARVASRGGKD